MAFTLSVANTLYATEDGLSWLSLEDSTDLLVDTLYSEYATEDGLSFLLAEDGASELLTETALGSSTDLTAYVQAGGVTLKFNTLDFTLVDPPAGSAPLAATVTTTNPAWTGNVVTTTSLDPIDLLGHAFYTVTATNALVLPNDIAPFDLSETASDTTFRYLLEDGSGYYLEEDGTDFAPGNLRLEGSLAYAYSGLSVRTQSNAPAADTTLGRCAVVQPGLRPGNVFKLTSSNQLYQAAPYQVTQATITWVRGTPFYSIEFGDVPATLTTYVQVAAPIPIAPLVAPTPSAASAAIPLGPVIYGNTTAQTGIFPMGGGVRSIASATFAVSAPVGHTLTCQVLGGIDARMEYWDNYVAAPRRGLRATLSGGIYTGPWQELPFGITRAIYDLSSAAGIALPSGTYTVTIDINTTEYNQMHVYSGWIQVSVTTV